MAARVLLSRMTRLRSILPPPGMTRLRSTDKSDAVWLPFGSRRSMCHREKEPWVLAEDILKGLKEPSTEEGTAKMIKLTEDLVKTLKKPPTEESTTEMLKLAADLVKTLKAPPFEAPKNELTMENMKIAKLHDQLYELKAHVKMTSATVFSILGVFGCLLVSLPNAVVKVDLRVENAEKTCSTRQQDVEKKSAKLKSRVSVLEAAKGIEFAETDEPEITPAITPVPEKSWFGRLSALLRR